MSVNQNEMRKSIVKMEEEINQQLACLQATAPFLLSLRARKISELEYIIKKMETEFSDELETRAQRVHAEIINLEKKINWEQRECSRFDEKIIKFNEAKENDLLKKFSKQILKNN